jgi:transcription elongation factor GreA
MAETYLTPEGYAKLKEEYRFLTEERRGKVARKIKEARELGDISENAEYDSAREEQAFVEGRILELKKLLAEAKVVEGETSGPTTAKSDLAAIKVGSRVKVSWDSQEEVFAVVGAQEADPDSCRISHESPLGRALLGKKVGEIAVVEAPAGRLLYTILEIN